MKFLHCLLASALLAMAAADCSSSTLSTLGDCYASFLKYYGLAFNGKLPVYWSVHQARGQVLEKGGVSSQPGVCDAAKALFACTNKVKYDTLCLSQLASNLSEAENYQLDKAVGNYQCTDGYQTLMANFDCLGAARTQFASEIDKCTTDMENSILQGTPVCTAEGTYLDCQMPYYEKACNGNFNAGVFICGTTRAGLVSARSMSGSVQNAASDFCDKFHLLKKCPAYRAE